MGAGPGQIALRVVWCAALMVAILAMAGGAYDGERTYQQVTAPFASLGLRLAPNPNAAGPRLAAPRVTGPGLADLRPGDEIVAVEGVASQRGWDSEWAVARQLAAARGPVVDVRTLSPDGVTRDHRLIRRPPGQESGGLISLHAQVLERVASALVAQLLQVAAAALLFLRRTRERLPALFSLALLLIVGGSASLWIGHVAPSLGAVVSAMLPLGWCGLLVSMLLFPSGRLEPRWTRWMLIPIGFWTLASWLLDSGLVIYPPALLELSGVAIFAVAVVAQVQRYRPLPPGPQRQQARWAMFGFGSACAVYLVDVVMQVWSAQNEDQQLAAWLGLAHPLMSVLGYGLLLGGLVVSLLRYRLYDAEMVISRSAGYAVLTLALAAVWAGAEQAIQVVFEDSLGQEQALSAGIAAALAAMLITPVHQRAMRWAERVFQKALAEFRLRLPLLVGDLRETASIDHLLSVTLERIHVGVRAQWGAVVLRGPRGWRTAAVRGTTPAEVTAWLKGDPLASAETVHRRDAMFPLRLPLAVRDLGPGEAIGWLLLGPRPDGSFFQRDELEALSEVCEPIARAVRIAIARTQREQALRTELQALKDELAALRTLVATGAARTVDAPGAARP